MTDERPQVTARIDSWLVRPCGDAYTPPEIAGIRLCGYVFGHHRQPDGKDVVTTRIVSVTGREVTTASGTRYHLGRINHEYREWLREHRPEWDWRHPITVEASK